jgi:hypothetical protein
MLLVAKPLISRSTYGQTGRDPGSFQIEVASEDGESDFVVTFAEALRDRAAVTWRVKASRLVS